MIRYLTESDVKQLLTMKDAVRLVEEAMKARAEGRASDVPRVRTRVPQGTLHLLVLSIVRRELYSHGGVGAAGLGRSADGAVVA